MIKWHKYFEINCFDWLSNLRIIINRWEIWWWKFVFNEQWQRQHNSNSRCAFCTVINERAIRNGGNDDRWREEEKRLHKRFKADHNSDFSLKMSLCPQAECWTSRRIRWIQILWPAGYCFPMQLVSLERTGKQRRDKGLAQNIMGDFSADGKG